MVATSPLPPGPASASALLTVLPRPGIKKFSEIQFNRNVSSASIVLRIIRNDNDKQRVLGQGSAAQQQQQHQLNFNFNLISRYTLENRGCGKPRNI